MLNKRIAVYVPSTVNGNEPAPPALVAKWVKAAKIKLATLFGGFTATPGVGGWVSPEHGLIEEPVTIVTSFTDEDGMGKLPEVVAFAADMAREMGQEAVSVEVGSILQFIDPAPAVRLVA